MPNAALLQEAKQYLLQNAYWVCNDGSLVKDRSNTAVFYGINPTYRGVLESAHLIAQHECGLFYVVPGTEFHDQATAVAHAYREQQLETLRATEFIGVPFAFEKELRILPAWRLMSDSVWGERALSALGNDPNWVRMLTYFGFSDRCYPLPSGTVVSSDSSLYPIVKAHAEKGKTASQLVKDISWQPYGGGWFVRLNSLNDQQREWIEQGKNLGLLDRQGNGVICIREKAHSPVEQALYRMIEQHQERLRMLKSHDMSVA